MAVSAVLFFWEISSLLLLVVVHKGAGVQSLTNGGQKIEVYRFGLFLEGPFGLHMKLKIIDAPLVSFIPFLPFTMMGIGLGPIPRW